MGQGKSNQDDRAGGDTPHRAGGERAGDRVRGEGKVISFHAKALC